MSVHAVDNNHAGERGSAANSFSTTTCTHEIYNYGPGIAKKETLFRRADSAGGLVMSWDVLRDVTNHQLPEWNLDSTSKDTMSVRKDVMSCRSRLTPAASQLLELAPREYTGVAIFEEQLVFICRDRNCKGRAMGSCMGIPLTIFTNRDHVECHVIGGVNGRVAVSKAVELQFR